MGTPRVADELVPGREPAAGVSRLIPTWPVLRSRALPLVVTVCGGGLNSSIRPSFERPPTIPCPRRAGPVGHRLSWSLPTRGCHRQALWSRVRSCPQAGLSPPDPKLPFDIRHCPTPSGVGSARPSESALRPWRCTPTPERRAGIVVRSGARPRIEEPRPPCPVRPRWPRS